MTLYAGADLRSNNNYLGIVNEANVVMFRKKLSCETILPDSKALLSEKDVTEKYHSGN
jgi:hypothetical protein